MKSEISTTPSAARNRVSSMLVLGRYNCLWLGRSSAGVMVKCPPLSASSSFANTEGESK